MSLKLLNKVVSIFTLIAFLATNVAYAAPESKSIFKNKKVNYQKIIDKNEGVIQQKKAVLTGESSKELKFQKREARKILSTHLSDISLIHIPQELGKVVEVYQNPDHDNSRLIVHIQDLHTNPEATLNLAGILEILVRDYNLGLVCSEGADGVVDTSSVSSFPDPEVRKKVARLFVDSGELTGEEYLSITKYPDLPIWGIENKDIYFKNIEEFNNIIKFNPDSQVFISQAKKALEELKPKIYSRELLAIDREEADYESQKAETAGHLKYLSSYIQKLNIPTANYKNIAILNETMAKESKIDQQKIMRESQNLLIDLQSAIAAKSSRSDMDILMAKASLFKDEKLSPFSFYSYLKDLANKHLKDQMSKYPNLMDFVEYLTKVNSLESAKLFVEMEDLSYEIKQRLARNDEEKTLTQALRSIKFLEGFFNLKISNEELDYYLQNKASCNIAFFEAFLKPAIKKYNLSSFVDFNPSLIDSHLQEIEDFYKTVKSRDQAMFTNTVSEVEKRNVRVATLITGGFHTQGITRLLKEKGYSYIVISPFSKTEIDEENYHFLLSGKRKPIEELIKDIDKPSEDKASQVSAKLRVPLNSAERLKEAISNVTNDKDKAVSRKSLASNEGPGNIAADYAYFEPKYIEAINLLVALHQEHLFAKWDGPGTNDDLKKKFLDQIIEANNNYPGGLTRYRENAKKAITDAVSGINPFKGLIPEVPELMNIDTLNGMDEEYHKLEAYGLSIADRFSIVVVAGGRGDRLKYNGIKLGIQLDLATERRYIEHFLEAREAIKEAVDTEIPFTIMTSDDNHDSTKDLFRDLGYQVISDNDGKAVVQKGKSKVVMIMQGLVPVVGNVNADFVLDPNDNYKLLAKPHGHGDVHMLLHRYSLVDEWIRLGKEYTLFIQDTNGQVFNSVLIGLAVTNQKKLDINFITVPREAGEAAGSIAKLKGPDDTSLVCNVEYNQIDPLLKETTGKGDVADPKTGKSPYPGNTNVYFVRNTVYKETLDRTKGIMPEFVNPKFTDDTKTVFEPARLETMMQDLARVVTPGAKVSATNYLDKREVFSPVKNDNAIAEKQLAKGNYPDHIATGAADYYKRNRKLLAQAGMKVDIEGKEQKTHGVITYNEGARVSFYRIFSTTAMDVISKIKGGSITGRSVLIIDGKDVYLEDVDIDGSLIIKVVAGATLRVKGLKVQNEGWELVHFTQEEMADSDTPEYLKIRGYKLVKKGQKVIDIQEPGKYEVGADGVLRKTNTTLASNTGLQKALADNLNVGLTSEQVGFLPERIKGYLAQDSFIDDLKSDEISGELQDAKFEIAKAGLQGIKDVPSKLNYIGKNREKMSAEDYAQVFNLKPDEAQIEIGNISYYIDQFKPYELSPDIASLKIATWIAQNYNVVPSEFGGEEGLSIDNDLLKKLQNGLVKISLIGSATGQEFIKIHPVNVSEKLSSNAGLLGVPASIEMRTSL